MKTTSSGRVRVGRRSAVAVAVAALAVASGCSNSGQPAPPLREGRNGPLVIDTKLISSLESFEACDDLLAYLRTEGAKIVGPYGFGGDFHAMPRLQARATAAQTADQEGASEATASAPPAPTTTGAPKSGAGTDYSGTNVQEEGVDEPDVVKTDGKRLVTIAGGQLRIVDVTSGTPRLVSSLRLGEETYLEAQLLLAGDRVLVLRSALDNRRNIPTPMPAPAPGLRQGEGVAMSPSFQAGPPRTLVTVVDISDTAVPRIVEEVTFDGSLVASRMVDGVARLVLRSGPPALPFQFPSGSKASDDMATETNKRLVAESDLDDWLPRFTVGSAGERQRMTECRDVRRPEVFSGVGMLSVVTLDASEPRPGPAATVIGAGEAVYASTENLYVTSMVWRQPDAPPAPAPGSDAPTTVPRSGDQAGVIDMATDVHKFDIRDKVRTTYSGSGRVTGRLLNSFSMSEHDGDLRVATTDDAKAESAVAVLRSKGDVLEQIGVVGGLGKTERIYAVRFLGTRGYVVTFRQTDPLYVLDLADPTKPAVTGELKIPGYSAYLHPVGADRLIGVGQDANDQGRVQGLQVSLFDVSDPASPKRLANATLAESQSEAEYDHHAFLYWPKTKLTVLPVQSYRDGTAGAVGFRVSEDEVKELGRIRQRDNSSIRRSMVVGDRLLTLSESGIQNSDVSSLDERGWLAFG